jgi:uncharacterized protein (TIGR03437 family)
LAADNAGDLFLTDGEHGRVLKVSPNGTITTVAGNGTRGFSGDGGTAASAQLNYPVGVAVDSAGNLFMVDNDRIRKISPDGTITTVAGNGGFGFSGDGGTATAAQLNQPFGVAVDGTGNLFIADTHNFRIRKVSPDATISTVAGGSTPPCCSSGDGGPATIAQLTSPADVAVDTKGNVFIADGVQVRRVSPDGVITTAAGNGTPGFSGDGGPATAAQLGQVGGLLFSDGIATDGSGNLFIADCNNFRVRKVAADGTITTIAGNGVQGYSGDGGPAITAQLGCPFRLVADAAGNLFVMDDPNHPRIRKVSRDGTITTVAGNGKIGFSGDGGPATSAALDLLDPNYCGFSGDCAIGGGMAVDGGGNLMFADTYNDVVREVSSSGIITTVVGGGKNSPGDGGPATSAQLFWPFGVAFDGVGNLFIAEVARIRKVSPSGTITTVAGSVVPSDVLYAYSVADYFTGYSGDGGPATGAAIGSPGGIALDGAGNIYFADPYNKAVRVLRPANHSVVIGAVVDAASQSAGPVSPGKIVVIYGAGLGPAQLVQNQASNGLFGASAGGTSVLFNGIAAPVLYASDTQVAAIVPYSITTTTAQVTVTYQGETSAGFSVTVAPSAPSLFTLNQTGAGQAAAINAVDGTPNSAANPVKIGGYISLYATGEGQTAPAGVDGKLSSTGVRPALPVSATIGGFPATVQFAGEAPGQVAGLMQVNLQVPSGVQTGGYVPVVLQVGNASTTADAVWIAVSGN